YAMTMIESCHAYMLFFFYCAEPRDLHSFPTRRSSDLGDLNSQCAPCVACKKHCPDIDLEQGYWKEASERPRRIAYFAWPGIVIRSEEHTSELQSLRHLVCRLLLEKKKKCSIFMTYLR